MWNRRYFDCFMRLAEFSMPSASLLFAFGLHHAVPPCFVCDGLNSYFDTPTGRHFRRMHLPLQQDTFDLTRDARELCVPAELVLRTMSSRL